MKKSEKKLLCKDCPFYTGIRCHGHGDYWGECNLLLQNSRILKKILNLDLLESIIPKGSDSFAFVCVDDSECKIFDIVRH